MEVSRIFQGRGLKEVKKVYQGGVHSVSKEFKGNLENLSRKVQRCFKKY